MRVARATTPDGVVSGQYIDDCIVQSTGESTPVTEQDLLAPSEPSVIYCVGRNYHATLDQQGYDEPDEPTFFLKPPVSVVAPGGDIPYPAFSTEVTYAGELAAVIDEECHSLSPTDARSVVRGYCILNDIDALDQPTLTARKAFTGSGPLGPWIETDLDPTRLDMTTTINGQLRQEANTSHMIFDPFDVISFLSNRFTFRPGDVVSFGSPENPGVIEPGDEIEISYEGIGTLRNTVRAPSG